MKSLKQLLLISLFMFGLAGLSTAQSLTPEEEQYRAAAQTIWDSLDRQQGEIKLPNDVATLNVPETFYYLNPTDSEKILVQVWGNPEGAGKKTLGMLFPFESTPFDQDSWGVTIQYEEDGYVTDKNADEMDYAAILKQMKEDTQANSEERVKQGYESIELLGWASPPFYDAQSHKLHWAKEVKFGSQTEHTLNYNIRVLGRKGVLVINFIASMQQKELIDSKLHSVLALAEFNEGSRYEDFNPELDEVAAYGIGALVAGKVIAKTGLIAAALIFLKKFGVLIVIGAGVLIGKVFKNRKSA